MIVACESLHALGRDREQDPDLDVWALFALVSRLPRQSLSSAGYLQ